MAVLAWVRREEVGAMNAARDGVAWLARHARHGLGWVTGWAVSGVAVVATLALAGCAGTTEPPSAAAPAPQVNVTAPTSNVEKVKLSLEAQAHPWSTMPDQMIDSAANAVCDSLRLYGSRSTRLEQIRSIADTVADNPDPSGVRPVMTYEQAVALQKTMASMYCPELGVG